MLDEASFPTNIRQLNFFTGESSRESLSFFEKLAQRTVDGIRLGLIIAITSVGLSLIFGTTGLTNFAHGELVTFGAMMVYLFGETIGLPLGRHGDRRRPRRPVRVRARRRACSRRCAGAAWAWCRRWSSPSASAILLRNVFLFQFGGDFRFLTAYNSQVAWDFGPVAITPRDFTITVALAASC